MSNNEELNNAQKLLEVQNLKMYFPLQVNMLGKARVHLRAVDDVSFTLNKGKTIGVVGESGCGKTTLGRTILKLYEATGGRVIYYGKTIDDFRPHYYIKGIRNLPRNSAYLKRYDEQIEKLQQQIADETKSYQDTVTALNEKSLLEADFDKLYQEISLRLDILRFNEAVNQLSAQGRDATKKQAKLDACKQELSNMDELLKDYSESALLELKELCHSHLSLKHHLEELKQHLVQLKEKRVQLINESSYSTGGSLLCEDTKELKHYLFQLLKLQSKLTRLDRKEAKLQEKECSTEERQEHKKLLLDNLHQSQELLKAELNEIKKLIGKLKEKHQQDELYAKLEQQRDKGLNLIALTKSEMRSLRTEIQLIFQDPYSSLPPRMTVGSIISEAVKVHHIVPKREIHDYVLEIMEKCGLQPHYYDRYPHEFSGGQRQRICIARALAVKPKLVICDEPVSALDVSIQAQIINLLKELQETMGLTYVFISHDLSVVKYITDDVMVMYLGNVMEIAKTEAIFDNPLHPYTKALFSAVPVPNPDAKMSRIILEGDIPSPANPPKGCKFHTRCNQCMGICKVLEPKYLDNGNEHYVSCHLYDSKVMAAREELEAHYHVNEEETKEESQAFEEE